MDHPVELLRIVFTRSIVIAVSDHEPNVVEKLPISPVNSLNINKVENTEDEYVVSMTTLMNENSENTAPYKIDMECLAHFKVDTTKEESELMKHLTFTGHSVVYGAIREAVSWITGRQPYGPLHLGLSILTPLKKEKVESAENHISQK